MEEKTVKQKIAYISGPISGIENLNRSAFDDAQQQLEQDGFKVINPHEVTEHDVDSYNIINFRPKDISDEDYKHLVWRTCMIADIEKLVRCTHVFVLPGWEHSSGANMEIFIAQKLRKTIQFYKSRQPFDIVYELTKIPKETIR